jgi:hypothetical protein
MSTPHTHHYHPVVEVLEGRCLPTSLYVLDLNALLEHQRVVRYQRYGGGFDSLFHDLCVLNPTSVSQIIPGWRNCDRNNAIAVHGSPGGPLTLFWEQRRPGFNPQKLIINGTSGNDRIHLGNFAGQAIVRGGPGDGVITGGRGNDRILGGPGNDRLSGGRVRTSSTAAWPGRHQYPGRAGRGQW